MRFVAFSDVHGNLESFKRAIDFIKELNDFSFILIAGDIADWPSPENVDESYENLLTMFELLERLDKRYFFVLGNWDYFFKEAFEKSRKKKIDLTSLFRMIFKRGKSEKWGTTR